MEKQRSISSSRLKHSELQLPQPNAALAGRYGKSNAKEHLTRYKDACQAKHKPDMEKRYFGPKLSMDGGRHKQRC